MKAIIKLLKKIIIIKVVKTVKAIIVIAKTVKVITVIAKTLKVITVIPTVNKITFSKIILKIIYYFFIFLFYIL